MIPLDDPGGQVAWLLSTSHAKKGEPQVKETLVFKGKTWTANKHKTHRVSNHARKMHGKSLLDGGANASHATPKDMELVAESATQRVDVVGMENHTCSDLPVATTAAVITRLGKGPCIGLFHQCAWNATNEEDSIHSAIQFEACGHDVNDKATAFGGKRMVTTLAGDIIPLSIKDGLPHMDMRKPTSKD